MKKLTLFAAILMLVAPGVFAGDGERRCTAPAEECIVKIREMMTGQMFLGVIFYDSETGIYVKSVVAGSPAEEAGLAAGDYIVGIEGTDLSGGDVKAFKKIFGKAQRQGTVTLEIRREGTVETLTRTAHLRQITEEQISRIIAAHLEAAHPEYRPPATAEAKQP
jgi:C-terminal processing protease CtpA/Prc